MTDGRSPGHSTPAMLRSPVVLVCALVSSLLAACGGAVSPTDEERGSPESHPRTSTTFFSLVYADNSMCMPQALARDASGVVTCRIVEALGDPKDTCAA